MCSIPKDDVEALEYPKACDSMLSSRSMTPYSFRLIGGIESAKAFRFKRMYGYQNLYVHSMHAGESFECCDLPVQDLVQCACLGCAVHLFSSTVNNVTRHNLLRVWEFKGESRPNTKLLTMSICFSSKLLTSQAF